MNNKPLICILGMSGVGKDTVANYLVDHAGMSKVKSYTTRKPRENDPSDIRNHTFVTPKQADLIASNEKIVASTHFADNFYFVTEHMLDNADLYILDLAGLKQLRSCYFERPIVAVYLYVNDRELRNRMTARGDSAENVEKRLAHDVSAFRGVNEYVDYQICNDGKVEDVANFIERLSENG